MKLFDIIGHRGASYEAPENTIASAKLAWEERADGIEVDIRMTLDEEIVVLHDETTTRTSKKKIFISKSTLAEAKAVDVGAFKGKKFVGEKIPTLREMLDLMPADKKIFIEFKCLPNALKKLGEVLEESGRAKDAVIVSFDLQTLKLTRAAMPAVQIYWIHDLPELDNYLSEWVVEKSLKENFNGFMFPDTVVSGRLVENCHKANLKVYAWTVNSPKIAKSLSVYGVDGVITDRPGWLREKLKLLTMTI